MQIQWNLESRDLYLALPVILFQVPVTCGWGFWIPYVYVVKWVVKYNL